MLNLKRDTLNKSQDNTIDLVQLETKLQDVLDKLGSIDTLLESSHTEELTDIRTEVLTSIRNTYDLLLKVRGTIQDMQQKVTSNQ